MKIIFTGTGSGQTSLKRFHSSFVIQSGNYNCLIDAGDGISKALLSSGIKYNSISSIIFTHMHPDHSAGLPSLIVQMKMLNREEALTIHCHKDHQENINALLKNTLILPERLKFNLIFRTYTQGEKIQVQDRIKFICALNSHLDDLKSNLRSGSDRVSCGFLFELKSKKIFYTGDIAGESDFYVFKDEKIDFIIAESTHVDLNLIISAFEKIGAGHLYLTHISEDGLNIINNEKVTVLEDNDELIL